MSKHPSKAGVDASRMRFGDAARAMRALLRNPDDTSQVFRVIDALSGRSGQRILRRFKQTDSGQRLLASQPTVLDLLTDQAALEKLPAGSLGREYLRFLRSEGITAEGLKQASLDARSREVDIPPDAEFLRNRMRDTHDLWHTVTGYKGDLVGEAALLAFIFAQTRNPGIGFIVLMAVLRGNDPRIRGLIWQGFTRGARAAWLPAVEWEELLAKPLEAVRHTLQVGPVPVYQPVRTAQYQRVMAA